MKLNEIHSNVQEVMCSVQGLHHEEHHTQNTEDATKHKLDHILALLSKRNQQDMPGVLKEQLKPIHEHIMALRQETKRPNGKHYPEQTTDGMRSTYTVHLCVCVCVCVCVCTVYILCCLFVCYDR